MKSKCHFCCQPFDSKSYGRGGGWYCSPECHASKMKRIPPGGSYWGRREARYAKYLERRGD